VAAVAAVIALVVAPHASAGIPVLVAALAAIVAGLLPSGGPRVPYDLDEPSTAPEEKPPI
jgi:hypothetical protein